MKRVLLKLSGEALANNSGDIYDVAFVDKVASAVVNCVKDGYEMALVIGAGNIWRGRQGGEMDRTSADRMGMLATVINAICVKEAIERAGKHAHVMTAIPMAPFAECYSAEAAVKYLEAGEVVIFGAGLGIPFLSTDTAGAVRAAEIGADAILMAKNVDGVYSADPKRDPNAVRYDDISYSEILEKGLRAFDLTAMSFCDENNIDSFAFALSDPENIYRAVMGEVNGTKMHR